MDFNVSVLSLGLCRINDHLHSVYRAVLHNEVQIEHKFDFWYPLGLSFKLHLQRKNASISHVRC